MRDSKPVMRLPSRTARAALLALLVVAVSAAAALPDSSAAPSDKASRAQAPSAFATNRGANPAGSIAAEAPRRATVAPAPWAALFSAGESISTFDNSNCTTSKSLFALGDTVCVVATGPLGGSGARRRVQLVNPDNLIVGSFDLTSSPQTITFPLPTDATGTLFDVPVDNRGTWRIDLVDTTDASVREFALISVRDPAVQIADLQINSTVVGSAVATAGSNVTIQVRVYNAGPDAAQNVEFADASPANTTFQSISQTTGPAFNCTTPAADEAGTTTCTRASLANGEWADFLLTYKVSGSIPNNTELTSSESVSSDTTDNRDVSNTSDSGATGSNPTPSTCTLACPSNIAAIADTTETVNGEPVNGTHVTLPAPTTGGSCGTVTSSIASGAFFHVGSTPVTYTAADGTECSFLVTVTTSGSPVSISCPANITANADADCQTAVTLGTPATTGDNVTVTGVRSDGKPLSAPFTSGITTITWTAANSSGTESCTQTVTILDVTPPVINVPTPAPVSADANCQAAIPDLTGGHHVTDNCACESSDNTEACEGHATIALTQSPAAGTLVGPGVHTITLTANDGSENNGGAGNTTVANVSFTVVDTTAPTLNVPANVVVSNDPGSCSAVVNFVGLSASDNCGTATISTSAASGSAFPKGTTTVTATATDGAGNTTTKTFTVTVNDTEKPVVNVPANITVYLPLNSPAVSMPVSFSVTATDNCGSPTLNVSPASGSVFPVGTTTVTATATDTSGNVTTKSFTVTVLYNFTGFFSPVDNLPVLNQVKAGQNIPLKFSLSGNKGLGILVAGFPASQQVNCATNVPINDLDETDTPGNSTLTYDAGSDKYQYNWKTEKTWAGQCRQLVVMLNDGSSHTANFKFK